MRDGSRMMMMWVVEGMVALGVFQWGGCRLEASYGESWGLESWIGLKVSVIYRRDALDVP